MLEVKKAIDLYKKDPGPTIKLREKFIQQPEVIEMLGKPKSPNKNYILTNKLEAMTKKSISPRFSPHFGSTA